MVLVSIVIDIERIGDYCKNILDLAAAHPKRLIVPEYEDVLVEVESGIKQGFAEAVSILREHDEEKARQAMIHYRDRVSDACDEIVSNIVRGGTDCVIPGDAAALALYVRYIKRISAHLKNMFSSVVNPFHRIGYKEKQPKHR
jgi:phosphate uptake regulator